MVLALSPALTVKIPTKWPQISPNVSNYTMHGVPGCWQRQVFLGRLNMPMHFNEEAWWTYKTHTNICACKCTVYFISHSFSIMYSSIGFDIDTGRSCPSLRGGKANDDPLRLRSGRETGSLLGRWHRSKEVELSAKCATQSDRKGQ